MTLENLIGKGLLREPTSPFEIARFQQKITKKLADAQCVEISLDTRYDTAYEALLQLGLVALRANGLRPDSRGGHHILALQTLTTSIGYGLPIIASDIPANLEVGLADEHYFELGNVESLANRLIMFSSRPFIEADCTKRIEWVLDRYNWLSIAKSTLAVYRDVCAH